MSNVTRVAIDLAKKIFHVSAMNDDGEVVERKRLRRAGLQSYLAQLPRGCAVAMEACGSAHHWGRLAAWHGHEVLLMNPQFVAPYVKSNKNDVNDADGIAEASTRPSMRFVGLKSVEQQHVQQVHRARRMAVRNRTGQCNQLHGLLLEYGIETPRGVSAMRRRLPEVLEDAENELPVKARALLHELGEELRRLDERVQMFDDQIAGIAARMPACKRRQQRETLACAVAALRARRARVLPRFAAAEDAARLAEVMSFALAARVVAERFAAVAGRVTAPGWRPLTEGVPEGAAVGGAPPPRPFGALLLARLAGEAGLGWLGQEPAALRALAAYFTDGPSELRTIAEEAECRIGLALDRGPAVPAPAAPPPAEEGAAGLPDPPPRQAATVEPAPAPERTAAARDRWRGCGWEWINWVRAGFRDGSVAVNTPGAWLHNIAGEAYVVSPACFEAFAGGRDLAPVTVRHRVVRLRRHRSCASRSGAANLFRAVLADGSRVEGMVFPGELVWDDDPPPRANASLVGKGR